MSAGQRAEVCGAARRSNRRLGTLARSASPMLAHRLTFSSGADDNLFFFFLFFFWSGRPCFMVPSLRYYLPCQTHSHFTSPFQKQHGIPPPTAVNILPRPRNHPRPVHRLPPPRLPPQLFPPSPKIYPSPYPLLFPHASIPARCPPRGEKGANPLRHNPSVRIRARLGRKGLASPRHKHTRPRPRGLGHVSVRPGVQGHVVRSLWAGVQRCARRSAV